MQLFTKEAPQGTYKRLTNLNYESDGSDNEQDCLPYPARKFPETQLFKIRHPPTSDNTRSSSTDDLHPFKDIRKVVEIEEEEAVERTVVYSGSDSLEGKWFEILKLSDNQQKNGVMRRNPIVHNSPVTSWGGVSNSSVKMTKTVIKSSGGSRIFVGWAPTLRGRRDTIWSLGGGGWRHRSATEKCLENVNYRNLRPYFVKLQICHKKFAELNCGPEI